MAKTIGIQDLPVKDLINDSANVRHQINPIAELEESISHHGVLEPIIVRKKGTKWSVVVGSRRLAAAKAVGLKTVPAILKELTDEEAFLESAIENIQREDLDPEDELAIVEKAHSIYKSVPEVAKALDRSKTWVEDHLRVSGFVSNVREIRGKAKGARAEPITVPRDVRKVASIARAADFVYEREPEKRDALFEELKDKPREQVDRTVRRLRELAEDEPRKVSERPVKEVISEVMSPNRLELSLEFSTEVSRGIIKAARARDVAEEDIVYQAVEEWLRRGKYL